jgi:hypothetical protein
MPAPDPPRSTPPRHLRRLAALLACIGIGGVIAVIGNAFSESQAWFLAIPAAVAVGWLFVANPTECEPPSHRR